MRTPFTSHWRIPDQEEVRGRIILPCSFESFCAQPLSKYLSGQKRQREEILVDTLSKAKQSKCKGSWVQTSTSLDATQWFALDDHGIYLNWLFINMKPYMDWLKGILKNPCMTLLFCSTTSSKHPGSPGHCSWYFTFFELTSTSCFMILSAFKPYKVVQVFILSANELFWS